MAQQMKLSTPAQGQADEEDCYFTSVTQELNNQANGLKSFREAAIKCKLSRPCINAAFVNFQRICDSLVNGPSSNPSLEGLAHFLGGVEEYELQKLSLQGKEVHLLMGVLCALNGFIHELMRLIQENSVILDFDRLVSSRTSVHDLILITEYLSRIIKLNVEML